MNKEMNKPKYQKLKEFIVETIKSEGLKPGDQIFSENEMSIQFKISRHTVRQAIGDLVSAGWLYRIQGKGTFVDRRPDIKKTQSKTIAVITTYLNDYIFPAIIRGIESVLSASGYNITLRCTYNTHEKERVCLEALKTQDIDALIVEPTKSALPNPNLDLYKELSSNGIPILFIHGYYKELNYSYIIEDDLMAGYMTAKHLIEQGHEKIGGIFKIDDAQGHARFAGFQKALLETGAVTMDSKIIWFDTNDAERDLIGCRDRLEDLIDECTGLITYNEQIAMKTLDIIRMKRISVPEDLSIISFDDSQLAVASEVKLTTIAHPKEKLGEAAGQAIINMIERKQNHYDTKMKPELIVRESTRKLL